jgi:hypothetical protein
MKYLPFLAILACVGGCGIFGGGSDSGSSDSKPAAADPRAAERAGIREKIGAKKQELAQADSDLGKIASERDAKAGEAASESKTNRLIELARLESDAKQRKAAITDEIANLEAQLNGASSSAPAAKPAKAGDALDDILAGNENKNKEDADRLKKKAEDDAAGDKARIAQADAAKKAEEDERAKQKIEGGRLAAGPDAPAFEDRWADVIMKVRGELQRFKRW